MLEILAVCVLKHKGEKGFRGNIYTVRQGTWKTTHTRDDFSTAEEAFDWIRMVLGDRYDNVVPGINPSDSWGQTDTGVFIKLVTEEQQEKILEHLALRYRYPDWRPGEMLPEDYYAG
jgi:hypothetical protein